MGNNKKLDINFTCSKRWDELSVQSSRLSYCHDCKQSVRDYSKVGVGELSTHCGQFNLSQVSSFNRSFYFNALKTPMISLFMLLGMSTISGTNLPEISESTEHNTLLTSDTNKLKVIGKLIDSETKEALSNGIIEVYHDTSKVGISITDTNGEFLLVIDGSKYNLQDLSVSFSKALRGVSTDTVPLGSKHGNLTLELKTKVEPNEFEEIFMMGGIEEVDH